MSLNIKPNKSGIKTLTQTVAAMKTVAPTTVRGTDDSTITAKATIYKTLRSKTQEPHSTQGDDPKGSCSNAPIKYCIT